MKRFHALACLACLAVSVPASAALAPEYQRIREFEAILTNFEVLDALENGEPIDRIEHVSRDLYRVTAGNCSVEVMLADDPRADPEVAGPRQFVMQVGEAECG
jgi:hypothetical protein